jgi:carbon storage regulator
MLVLSRKSTESIQIGDHVVVKVLDIRGKKVRLGIDAPEETHIVRSELRDAGFDPAMAKDSTTISAPLVHQP